MSRIRTLVSAALATAICGAPLAAQNTANASLSVTAKVVNPIALAVTAPLDFGSMFAGNAKTIAPDAATSGRFNVSGESGAAVNVTLSMPVTVATAGGATIPLSNWNYLLAPNGTFSGATAVSFNPQSATPVSTSLTGGKIFFGLGATATPAANAVAGNYAATGQITVAYVGL